jgi:hypothetical protein
MHCDIISPFLTSAVDGVKWSVSSSGSYGKSPCSHLIGDWVESRAGIEDVEQRKNSYLCRE